MSLVNKIILGHAVLLAILGIGVAYNVFHKPAKPVPTIENKKTEKRHIKRTFTSEGKLASEDIEESVSSKMVKVEIKPKPYLLGATLSYDFDQYKVRYNIIAGKQIIGDCYAIAKASTDLNLNHVEAGVLCAL
jgi:hypothetical protein